MVEPSPNASDGGTLSAVSAESRWAVGELTERWNGTAWHIKKAAPGTELYGVDAFAPSDVWAVGAVLTPSGQTVVPLTQIQHFDGSSWTVVPSPNVLVAGKLIANILSDVSGSSPSDIWALGERY